MCEYGFTRDSPTSSRWSSQAIARRGEKNRTQYHSQFHAWSRPPPMLPGLCRSTLRFRVLFIIDKLIIHKICNKLWPLHRIVGTLIVIYWEIWLQLGVCCCCLESYQIGQRVCGVRASDSKSLLHCRHNWSSVQPFLNHDKFSAIFTLPLHVVKPFSSVVCGCAGPACLMGLLAMELLGQAPATVIHLVASMFLLPALSYFLCSKKNQCHNCSAPNTVNRG